MKRRHHAEHEKVSHEVHTFKHLQEEIHGHHAAEFKEWHDKELHKVIEDREKIHKH